LGGRWPDAGVVLAGRRRGAGRALAWCWPGAGVVLAGRWRGAGRVLTGCRAGESPAKGYRQKSGLRPRAQPTTRVERSC
ncbi:MAG: hypothetical protein ABI972_17215, partial [Acidobacteriota bacterium]